MPMLMRLEWLLKAGPLARRLDFPPRQESRLFQHPPNARRTHCHNVSVQHHERQPSIAFQRILQMEIDDSFLLPCSNQKSRGTQPLCSLTQP